MARLRQRHPARRPHGAVPFDRERRRAAAEDGVGPGLDQWHHRRAGRPAGDLAAGNGRARRDAERRRRAPSAAGSAPPKLPASSPRAASAGSPASATSRSASSAGDAVVGGRYAIARSGARLAGAGAGASSGARAIRPGRAVRGPGLRAHGIARERGRNAAVSAGIAAPTPGRPRAAAADTPDSRAARTVVSPGRRRA